jgi:RND family efflux transporter MFP subunit
MGESLKKWSIVIPLALGIGALVVMVKNRSQPNQAPVMEQARPVRVIEAPRVTAVPRALGYGNVEPGKTWEAIAEVNGKIVEIHPQLKRGAVMAPGQVLFRIDPTDYELAVAETETKIQSTRAQLAELEVKEANNRASLAIEQGVLELGEKELERKRTLVARGTVTRSEVDREERTVLGQRQSVQNLRNTLNLIPAERKLLEAQLARDRAQLASVRRDLERTTILSPFAGRVAEVKAELAEYVRQGDVLAAIDGIDVAEIPAQVPMGKLGALIRSERTLRVLPTNLEVLREAMGLSARVWLRGENLAVMWEGRVARFSDTIDPQTRTVGVIVEVDGPYENVQPGVRPPLLKGLFVEVELRGRPLPDRMVIPRSALHGDQVYLLDDEDRLSKRTVDVGLVQPDFVVIDGGIEDGERVVISDLIPAIEGMLLAPLPDPEVLARLAAEAGGEEALP